MFAVNETQQQATIIKDVLPQGRAAVLQDTFLELLKEATGLYKRQGKLGDKSRYITLTAEDTTITGEIWTKAGEYVALQTIVKARVETYFRIAVDLETLKMTVALAYKNERIDMKVNVDTNTLNLHQMAQDSYGNMRIGWQSNFKGLPSIEMQKPVDAEPVPTYTKEQVKEFKWISKAMGGKNEPRYCLQFAHAEKNDGISFIAASDGYRMHITMNHAAGLNGYIDIKNVGPKPDYRYVDVASVAAKAKGQKVNVYYGDLLKAVKSALKVKPDGNMIDFSFRKNVLTISGCSMEHGESTSHILCSNASYGCFTVNGQYILDSLAGCDGIPNSKDVNLQSVVMLQYSSERFSPIRVIAHPGRAAYIMPKVEA